MFVSRFSIKVSFYEAILDLNYMTAKKEILLNECEHLNFIVEYELSR